MAWLIWAALPRRSKSQRVDLVRSHISAAQVTNEVDRPLEPQAV